MKKFITTFVLLLFIACVSAQNVTYSRIKIKIEPQTFEKLGKLGIAPDGYVKKNAYFITEIPDSIMHILQENEINFEVLVNDISAFYVNRSNDESEKSGFRNCDPGFDYAVPLNFSTGSMGGFFTLDEIYEELDSMRARFPALVSVRQPISAFTTHNGRSLYYVKISKNPDIQENEPKVYYQSLVHAREPMGMQQLFFYMWYLLENYSSDAEIQYLLDNAELYFIPCANPDGYEYNRQTNPSGGGMWRKNRRNNSGGSYGVDLNRNFGFMWGYDDVGSSPNPSTDTYRGPSAFSESETQAVKWLCEQIEPALLLDYHTYSDVLLYPWGYINQKCADSVLYDVYSSFLVSENKFAFGTAYQTIGYNANGGSFDWYYGEQATKDKIIAWGPEAGNAEDGFWPAPSRIIDISKNYMAMNLYAARFALCYAEVTDKTDSYIFGQNQKLYFDIQRLGMHGSGDFTVTLHPLQNVISAGTPVAFNGMTLLETKSDSIGYTLGATISPGDIVKFVIELNNGFYSNFDTITKIYGESVVLFEDDCSDLASWTGNWATTTSQYVSAPSSITDSPGGFYPNNTSRSITTTSSINLSDAVAARVSFFAKWDIEKSYDFVQFSVSSDNGTTWNPLCGRYTVDGTTYQDQGQPLYDGFQGQWVLEEIDLQQWLGQNIKFRFRLVSDFWTNADGFYFDDFLVQAILDNPTHSTPEINSNLIVYPNPTMDFIRIESNNEKIGEISLLGLHGQLIQTLEFCDYGCEFDVRHLPNGIYILLFQTESGCFSEKIIINR